MLEIALQLLARPDTEHQAWSEETRQQIAIGIAELERGEGVDSATAMQGLARSRVILAHDRYTV